MASQLWLSLSTQHSCALITKYTSLVAHPVLTTATGMVASAQACKCQHCAHRADKPWVPNSAIRLSKARLFLTWDDGHTNSLFFTGPFKRLVPRQRAASVQTAQHFSVPMTQSACLPANVHGVWVWRGRMWLDPRAHYGDQWVLFLHYPCGHLK